MQHHLVFECALRHDASEERVAALHEPGLVVAQCDVELRQGGDIMTDRVQPLDEQDQVLQIFIIEDVVIKKSRTRVAVASFSKYS